jgi:hypothetical protein
VVLTTSEYEFRERLHEQCIWNPKIGTRLSERKWVGKPVHVTWQHPEMLRNGTMVLPDSNGLGKSSPTYGIKWFGYVQELGRQVPGEELLPMPKDQNA